MKPVFGSLKRSRKPINLFLGLIKKRGREGGRRETERERTQINKIRNRREEKTTDTTVIQKNVREYEKLLAKKLNNLQEMDTCLKTYNLPNLNQKEVENLCKLLPAMKLNQ